MVWLIVFPVGYHLRLPLDYMHVSEAPSVLQDMIGSVNVGARDVRSNTKAKFSVQPKHENANEGPVSLEGRVRVRRDARVPAPPDINEKGILRRPTVLVLDRSEPGAYLGRQPLDGLP